MSAVLGFSIIAFGYMTPFAIILSQGLGKKERMEQYNNNRNIHSKLFILTLS